MTIAGSRILGTDSRLDLMHILSDTVNACDERSRVISQPSLQSGWDGGASLPECRWFTKVFIDDAQHEARIWRAVEAVPAFFRDLAKLHYFVTGEPAVLDQVLIEKLQRAVMIAIQPSDYEIGIGARNHPAAVASQHIQQWISEEQWHKRF